LLCENVVNEKLKHAITMMWVDAFDFLNQYTE